uniref:Uncharacterized protein n=1 Tax=Noctiluca scintillans TaxID=2966 RepID=A0A7S1F2J9_NOCSC
MTFGMQIAAMVCIKVYVTPAHLHHIRDAYDKYEFIMHGSVESHTYLTIHGERRGFAEYFEPSLIAKLDDDELAEMCNIPFSQIGFFALVLFIWNITCFSKMKLVIDSFVSLIISTPTVSSMRETLQDTVDEARPRKIITGLTARVKIALSVLVFFPWLITTLFMLWLGCRWLTATNDFGELVLNAVALEFILQLKELVYQATVSERNQRDLSNTLMTASWKNQVGYITFLIGIWPGVIALLWIYLYIVHFQSVLVDYKWDIHDACTPYHAALLGRLPPGGVR